MEIDNRFQKIDGVPKICAAYLIVHRGSGQMYVGSTDDIYVRQWNHQRELRLGKHHNHKLQSAYKADPNVEFYVAITWTREKAYELEQEILDKHYDGSVLFNLARNARVFGKGVKKLPEHIEKIREGCLGKNSGKSLTEEHKEKLRQLSLGRRIDEETKEKMRRAAKTPAKRLCADGKEFSSLKAAARSLGVSKSCVKQRCESKSPRYVGWYFLDTNSEDETEGSS